MDNYFSMSIQGMGLQVLETVHIISTTKNLDTIKSRYELLLERIATLRTAESNRLYSTDINTSIETVSAPKNKQFLNVVFFFKSSLFPFFGC